MNTNKAFIVNLASLTGPPKSVAQWLTNLDSFRLSPTVFLVRGLSFDGLALGIKSRLTDSEAYFVCGLEANARLDGCTSANFNLLQWLNVNHVTSIGTHCRSISTGRVGKVVLVDNAAEKADLKLASGTIEQFPILDLEELREI